MLELSNSTVLVVDDAETNIDILMETLGDDYDVSVAMDGESALESVASDRPRLDSAGYHDAGNGWVRSMQTIKG